MWAPRGGDLERGWGQSLAFPFPIQVLTRPDPAYLQRSDAIRHVQGGMALDWHFLSSPKIFSKLVHLFASFF